MQFAFDKSDSRTRVVKHIQLACGDEGPMGQEAEIRARIGEKVELGKVLLETDYLLFRGKSRVKVLFKDIMKLSSGNGWLEVVHPGGTAHFELGTRAAKWAEKIRSPRSLLDKLGVKPDSRVAVIGVADTGFLAQLRERVERIPAENQPHDCDFVFYAAEEKSALARLKGLARLLKKTGAVWVVYPKGQKQITENDILAAGKSAGLVDVKVCSFSPTHTALKFVIPVARRQLR